MISLKAKPQKTAQKDSIDHDVSLYLSGNKEAFLRIKNYLDPVINIILDLKKRSIPNYHLEDIRQEFWIEILSKLPKFDPERGALKHFVFCCLKNCLNSYFRRENRYSERFILSNQIEGFLIDETEEPPPPFDLDLRVQTRISGSLIHYILRRVAVALYFNNFERYKKTLIKDLCLITEVDPQRIIFFVDYSLVIIRRHCLED